MSSRVKSWIHLEEQDRLELKLKLKLDPVNFTQKTDATDLSSKKNMVTGSPFSQIDYNFPVEHSLVAPQVQTFVSLFRIKKKTA